MITFFGTVEYVYELIEEQGGNSVIHKHKKPQPGITELGNNLINEPIIQPLNLSEF